MRLRRAHGVGVLLLALGLLIGLDLIRSAPVDPFQAPPPLAWGSGEKASGGFCAVPTP